MKKYTEYIGLRISPELKKRLKCAGEKTHRSLSNCFKVAAEEWVTKILKDGVDNKK